MKEIPTNQSHPISSHPSITLCYIDIYIYINLNNKGPASSSRLAVFKYSPFSFRRYSKNLKIDRFCRSIFQFIVTRHLFPYIDIESRTLLPLLSFDPILYPHPSKNPELDFPDSLFSFWLFDLALCRATSNRIGIMMWISFGEYIYEREVLGVFVGLCNLFHLHYRRY